MNTHHKGRHATNTSIHPSHRLVGCPHHQTFWLLHCSPPPLNEASGASATAAAWPCPGPRAWCQVSRCGGAFSSPARWPRHPSSPARRRQPFPLLRSSCRTQPEYAPLPPYPGYPLPHDSVVRSARVTTRRVSKLECAINLYLKIGLRLDLWAGESRA